MRNTMNLTVKISEQVDELEWDNALTRSKYSTGFQTANFFKPNKTANNSKPIFIIVLDNSNQIVGQLSAVINLHDTRRTSNSISKFLINNFNLSSILSWKHGPIIHDKENHKEIQSEIFHTIEKICLEKKISMAKGTSPPLDTNFSEKNFQDFGYSVIPWKNYIIDLPQNPDDYYFSLHNKIRYDIRKAEKNGLTFKLANTIEDLKEFRLLKFDFKHKNSKSIENRTKKTWEYQYENGLRKLFLVHYDKKIIGGISALVFNNIVCHTTVVNTSQKNLQGGSFLTWNSIKWAIDNKQSILDLGGANPSPQSEKEKGIDHYKSKWNGHKNKTYIFSKNFLKNRSKFSSFLKRI